jgi:hypothetical protein
VIRSDVVATRVLVRRSEEAKEKGNPENTRSTTFFSQQLPGRPYTIIIGKALRNKLLRYHRHRHLQDRQLPRYSKRLRHHQGSNHPFSLPCRNCFACPLALYESRAVVAEMIDFLHNFRLGHKEIARHPIAVIVCLHLSSCFPHYSHWWPPSFLNQHIQKPFLPSLPERTTACRNVLETGFYCLELPSKIVFFTLLHMFCASQLMLSKMKKVFAG